MFFNNPCVGEVVMINGAFLGGLILGEHCCGVAVGSVESGGEDVMDQSEKVAYLAVYAVYIVPCIIYYFFFMAAIDTLINAYIGHVPTFFCVDGF